MVNVAKDSISINVGARGSASLDPIAAHSGARNGHCERGVGRELQLDDIKAGSANAGVAVRDPAGERLFHAVVVAPLAELCTVLLEPEDQRRRNGPRRWRLRSFLPVMLRAVIP